MTLLLKHQFVSAKSDGPDSTLVKPSDWNNTHTMTQANNRLLGLGIGSDGPTVELTPSANFSLASNTLELGAQVAFPGTGATIPPKGTTAQRPATPILGMLRYNTSVGAFEVYNGNTWTTLSIPPGTITFFASITPPFGFFKCDGSAVSRTTYAALFAVCGGTFGAGDGSTTFNLPDTRGRFPRSWDNGKGIDPSRAFGSVQGFATMDHSHGGGVTGAAGVHAHNVYGQNLTNSYAGPGANLNVMGYPAVQLITSTDAQGNHTHTVGSLSNLSGGPVNALGNEIRPNNIALNICIKY